MTNGNSRNYFELFGIPVSFHLDTDALAQRYRELQRVTHPDRFANGTDRERRLAVEQAALVNEAYQTLRFPMNRGRYLLELNGVVFNDENQTTSDSEFLLEQMEWRELLAEVREQSDSLGVLTKLLQTINVRRVELEQELASALGSSNWQTAMAIVTKLQFITKINQEAEAIEGELLDNL